MAQNIEFGKRKPTENQGGDNKEKAIVREVRTPKSDFDRRVNGDGGPVSYFGPGAKANG